MQEKTFLTEEDVRIVSEEISGESKGFSSEPDPLGDEINIEFDKDKPSINLIEDLDYIQGVISDFRQSLETSIEYKLKISKYLDNVIKRKLQRIKSNNISNEPEQ